VKGALERVLQKCTKYLWNGQLHQLNDKKEQEFLAEAYEIGRKGLRGNLSDPINYIYKKKYTSHTGLHLASRVSELVYTVTKNKLNIPLTTS
jgi:magnesium-transporting ATPase (P-type)